MSLNVPWCSPPELRRSTWVWNGVTHATFSASGCTILLLTAASSALRREFLLIRQKSTVVSDDGAATMDSGCEWHRWAQIWSQAGLGGTVGAFVFRVFQSEDLVQVDLAATLFTSEAPQVSPHRLEIIRFLSSFWRKPLSKKKDGKKKTHLWAFIVVLEVSWKNAPHISTNITSYRSDGNIEWMLHHLCTCSVFKPKTFCKRSSRHWMVKESCGPQSIAARALFCKQSTLIAALFELKPPPEDSEELWVWWILRFSLEQAHCFYFDFDTTDGEFPASGGDE